MDPLLLLPGASVSGATASSRSLIAIVVYILGIDILCVRVGSQLRLYHV